MGRMAQLFPRQLRTDAGGWAWAAMGGLYLGLLHAALAQSDRAAAEPFCTGNPLASTSVGCLLARHGCASAQLQPA